MQTAHPLSTSDAATNLSFAARTAVSRAATGVPSASARSNAIGPKNVRPRPRRVLELVSQLVQTARWGAIVPTGVWLLFVAPVHAIARSEASSTLIATSAKFVVPL